MLVGKKIANRILSAGLPALEKTSGGVYARIASISSDKPGCLFLILGV